MGEVKWIKLAVDMFSNRKIRMIESMDNGDALLVFWVKLLTLAGQINDGGQIYFTPEMPYTQKSLALYLNTNMAIVSHGLDIFAAYGMIELDEGYITIANWERYQNIDAMERMREKRRARQAVYRAKRRLEKQNDVAVTSPATQNDAIDKDIDIEKDKDKTLTCFNARTRTREEKPVKHRYGEYKNVLLTDEELEKLKERFPQDWERRIEDLSLGIESKGYKYKSHYAALLSWARRDEARKPSPKQGSAEELDDFYKMVADWAKEDDG